MKIRYRSTLILLTLLSLILMTSVSSAAQKQTVRKIDPQIKDLRPIEDIQFKPDEFTALTNLDFKYIIPYLAYSTQTELFIQKDSGEFHNYFKKEKLDWNFPNQLNVKFAWKSEQTNFTRAVWQVSLLRYKSDIMLWDKPAGLVASGDVPLNQIEGNYHFFHVNFADFAPQKPLNLTHLQNIKLQTNDKVMVRRDINLKDDKSAIKRTDTTPLKKERYGLKTDLMLKEAVDYRALKKIDYKIPQLTLLRYYVRIVLLDSNRVIELPSDPVEITYGELPPPEDVEYVDPDDITPPPSNLPVLLHPDIKITKYVPIQQEKMGAMYHFEVIRDFEVPGFGVFYHKGDKLDMTPHEDDKNWLEAIGDFFGSIFGFVKDAVNWVAEAYEDIKKFAINQVVNVLGEWSRGPLTAGLEIGLAAVGLPPSIPDFDELTSMGKDYLIKAAADYAGLPPEETAKAVDALISEASRHANGGGDPDVWLKPDPDWYYRPAYLELVVTNYNSEPSNRVYANIHITVPDDEDETLFDVPYAFIPALQPYEKITLPVFLEEYTKNRMLDTNPYEGLHRFWKHYNTMRARVNVYSWGSDSYQNPYKLTQSFWLDPCYQEMDIAVPAPPVSIPVQ